MKVLARLDDWLEENQLRRFVNETSLKWFLILLAGGTALAIHWSLTRVAVVVFVAYYVLNPITVQRLAQLIILLCLGLAILLIVNNELRASSVALAIYLLFGVLLVRLIWDEWRSKSHS